MKIVANGFTFDLPAGWDDRSLLTFVGEVTSSGFAVNVVVTRQRVQPHTSVEDYAHAQRQAMYAELPALEILDERATRIAGAPAFQRLHRFPHDDLQLQQVQTFILAQDTIFVVTGTAPVADFDRHIPAFRRIVESIKLFDSETLPV